MGSVPRRTAFCRIVLIRGLLGSPEASRTITRSRLLRGMVFRRGEGYRGVMEATEIMEIAHFSGLFSTPAGGELGFSMRMRVGYCLQARGYSV